MLTTYTQAVAGGILLPSLAELASLHAQGQLSQGFFYWSSRTEGAPEPGWVWGMIDGVATPNSPNSLCHVYVEGEDDSNDVPGEVTAAQFRYALRKTGLLDTVEAWVRTQSAAVQDWWEYEPYISPQAVIVRQAAEMIGVTKANLRMIFGIASEFDIRITTIGDLS